MNTNEAQDIVEEVFQLYTRKGDEAYHGEPVSQLQHMLQAATLAINEQFDDETVLAAFFHDIGHLLESSESMGDYGVVDHEKLGASYLESRGFGDKIVDLVKRHVEAKRYLTAIDPTYYPNLSRASKATLQYQGGPMNEEEIKVLEKDPLKELIIKMRTWDEAAKVPEMDTVTLDILKKMTLRYLMQR